MQWNLIKIKDSTFGGGGRDKL